jgi:hypothetical protein
MTFALRLTPYCSVDGIELIDSYDLVAPRPAVIESERATLRY